MREDIGLSFWIQLLPLICWPSLVLFIILKMTLFCSLWLKKTRLCKHRGAEVADGISPTLTVPATEPRCNDSIHWLEHSINWSQNLTEQTGDPWRRAEGTGWGGVLGKVFPASSWLFSMWMYLCSQVCVYTCIQKGSKTDNYISVTTQNSLNVDFVGVYAFETGHHRSVQGDLELLRARITGVWKKTLSCLSLPSKGPSLAFLFIMSRLAIGSLDSGWLISERFLNPWSTSRAFELCADGPFPRAVAWNPHAHVQLLSHTQGKHFFIAAFFYSSLLPQEKPLHLLMDNVLELPCQNDFPNGKSNGASHWQRRPPHLQLGTRDTPSPDAKKCNRSWLGVYALLI